MHTHSLFLSLPPTHCRWWPCERGRTCRSVIADQFKTGNEGKQCQQSKTSRILSYKLQENRTVILNLARMSCGSSSHARICDNRMDKSHNNRNGKLIFVLLAAKTKRVKDKIPTFLHLEHMSFKIFYCMSLKFWVLDLLVGW